MLNSTPRTWAAGETVTAAELNAEIRDAFNALQAAWTTYAPTWTSTGTAPSIGNGTLTGRYTRIGKTVFYVVRVVFGSTTTFGTGSYVFGLPVTISSALGRFIAGSAHITDSGTGYYAGLPAVYAGDAGNQSVRINGAGSGTEVGPTYPITFASGDSLTISGTYEAA